MRCEPFRKIGPNVVGRGGKIGGGERFGKWRRRVPIRREGSVQRRRRLAPFEERDADREVPGRIAAHPPRERRALLRSAS